jgi:hypothetical protein
LSKYSFERMNPDQFEGMAKALIDAKFRLAGNLIQFGDGPDGGREATWTEPVAASPKGRRSQRTWLFQVKYHDIGLRGWQGARDALLDEFPRELQKLAKVKASRCDVYVLITNVPFTGVRGVGTRDRIQALASRHRRKLRDIQIWDAADLSAMLDASSDVRTAYLETILPGDVLARLLRHASLPQDRLHSALRAYLRHVFSREQDVRAEEAGDEPGLRLQDVFIDIDLKLLQASQSELGQAASTLVARRQAQQLRHRGSQIRSESTPASTALLLLDYPAHFLLGGPGYGKSTLTQFLVFLHAARVISPAAFLSMASKLKLPSGMTAQQLDASCRPRVPFRIELRRYALWLTAHDTEENPGHLARYIAEALINANASSALTMDDVFGICAANPILLVLDGLDEVPHPDARKQILTHAGVFVSRATAENSDLSVILSSRPRGYAGEFDTFSPLTWELLELTPGDLKQYCDHWLTKRLPDADDRTEARLRLNRGLESEAVRHLATTLLQATVMLAIVRRKVDIPHERHALYSKYVDVTFEREKLKSSIVRDHAAELLRLHERVGYELHKRMEDKDARALGADGFRALVLDTLAEYSTTPLTPTLATVAEAIISASKDRLCMLAGKGVQQTDMDFVVQTYREYFAAEHLANHSRADPDKIFHLLVARGAYWANVLQFYVARAQPNQQLRWILRAAGGEAPSLKANDLLSLVRTRRALLPLLPELGRQQRNDFLLCLRTIFDPALRWTFVHAHTYGRLLQEVRGGSAAAAVLDSLNLSPMDDVGRAVADIRLFCDIVSAAKESDDLDTRRRQEENVRTTLLKAAGISALADTVCAEVMEHNIPIDLASFSLESVARGVPQLRQGTGVFSKRFVAAQSLEGACALAYLGSYVTPLVGSYKLEALLSGITPSAARAFHGERGGLSFAPHLCRSTDDCKSLRDWAAHNPSPRGPASQFFASLCDAVDSKQPSAYEEAERRHAALGDVTRLDWEPSVVLGPAPSAFESTDQWLHFRGRIQTHAATSPFWLPELILGNGGMETTLLLAFHPSLWERVAGACGVTTRHLDAIAASPAFDILSMPSTATECILRWHHVMASEILSRRDWPALLRHAGAAGATHRVSRSVLLPFTLRGVTFGNVERSVVTEMQREAKTWQGLPLGWASVYLRICAECSSRDLDLMLGFFENYPVTSLPEIRTSETEPTSAIVSDLVRQLLDAGTETALRLAATLATGYPLNEQARKPLHAAAVRRLLADDTPSEQRLQVAQLLLNGGLGIERLDEVLQNSQVRQLVDTNFGLLEAASGTLLRRATRRDPVLRPLLEYLVGNRTRVPWQMAAAAIQGLLASEAVPAGPLEDNDWRCSPLAGC